VDQFYKEIEDKEVGTLINNAGLARGKDALENYEWGDIEQMLDTNIKGFIRVAQLAIPFLKKTKGHIVNISSIAGMEAYEGGAVYCGTKAFVRMISRSLRIDVLGTGIRVTDIAPGAVDTEFSTVRFKGDTAKAKKVYEGFVPLHAEDIADCICFVLNRPPHVNVAEMLILPTAQSQVLLLPRSLLSKSPVLASAPPLSEVSTSLVKPPQLPTSASISLLDVLQSVVPVSHLALALHQLCLLIRIH
jgi:NADP-dependent 3-hydroxy acid dehydrogenase YdfG